MIPELLAGFETLLPAVPLATDIGPWDVLPPGVWLIFGIIGLPVYVTFFGWFLGKPKDSKTVALGSTLFLTLTSALWFGLFATTLVIRLLFF